MTLLVGISLAAWASQVSASGRDAAIRSCIARAQQQYPSPGSYDSNMSNRTFAYKACMRTAGFLP
jgi:hypothetical protein